MCALSGPEYCSQYKKFLEGIVESIRSSILNSIKNIEFDKIILNKMHLFAELYSGIYASCRIIAPLFSEVSYNK